MSHVKNVAAFEKLLGHCSGYGGSYNPGMSNLTVSTMSDLLEKARQAVQQANASMSDLSNETNQREIFFDNLPRLTSSIIYCLAASGATDQTLKDARVFFRQITGRKLSDRKPIPSEQSKEAVVNRSRQLGGYVNTTGQFAKLLEMIKDEPRYRPNETHLQVAGLREALKKMERLNTNVSETQVKWSNARMVLNNELYASDTSLYVTANFVKKYVRAAFGLKSEQYRQLKSLPFTKPRA